MIIGRGSNLTYRQVEEDVMELQARRLITQHCVWTSVNVNPLDIFKATLGQFPAKTAKDWSFSSQTQFPFMTKSDK